MFSTVSGPPFPRGTTWSTSRRTVAPQTSPFASFHWHLPWSRFTTARFTLAGTEAFLRACRATRSSSAAVSTCSSVAHGFRCDSPALAFRSRATNGGETVMCRRVSTEVSGSMVVRLGWTGRRGRGLEEAPAADPPSGWVRCRSTGWTLASEASRIAGTGREVAAFVRTCVTSVRAGTRSGGDISATTCLASCFERWKNRGRATSRFASVITLASWVTLVMQSRPSRIGSTTSGNRWTRRQATCR